MINEQEGSNSPRQEPSSFTSSEVARLCHVDLKTIHNWSTEAILRHFGHLAGTCVSNRSTLLIFSGGTDIRSR